MSTLTPKSRPMDKTILLQDVKGVIDVWCKEQIAVIFFFGFESTQLARRVRPKRTQMEVQ